MICLKRARQMHDAYLEQRLRLAEQRVREYESVIGHLVDVVETGAEPCQWVLRQARTAKARATL